MCGFLTNFTSPEFNLVVYINIIPGIATNSCFRWNSVNYSPKQELQTKQEFQTKGGVLQAKVIRNKVKMLRGVQEKLIFSQ